MTHLPNVTKYNKKTYLQNLHFFIVSKCYFRGDVDLDGKNIGGWTPLMYAAYIGHDSIAKLLLETGISVNTTTSKGLTPLMLAASCGNESIAHFLLQVRIFQQRQRKVVS